MSTSSATLRVTQERLMARAVANARPPSTATATPMIAAEAAAGAVLVTSVVALASPGDVWLGGVGFHPAWIAVLAVAARYGTWGLLLALGMTAGALASASLAFGGSLAGITARATNTNDLLALAAAVVVAWIAMLHESRIGRLAARLLEADRRRREANETVEAMHTSVALLRARLDRMDLSLHLWRDLAGRLERGDDRAAAKAALELCGIRCGATSGAVQAWDGRHLRLVASHGIGPSGEGRAFDLASDRTVATALAKRRPTAVTAVEGATEDDSDLAIPIGGDGDNPLLGVLAVRLGSPDKLGSELRDLQVIAGWLAPALARAATIPRLVVAAEAAHS